MTLASRRARPVYRVYSAEDYLAADADPFAEWDSTESEPVARRAPARALSDRGDRDRTPREHRLRRLAGAAALAGAVGAVGGAVGIAFVHGRPAAGPTEVADRSAPGAPAARSPLGRSAALRRSPGERSAAQGRSPRGRSVRWRSASSPAGPAPSSGQAHRLPIRTHAVVVASPSDGALPAGPASTSSAVRVAPAPSASAAASTVASAVGPASAASGRPAQAVGAAGAEGEFGFER